jgi:hypothetical protein
MFLENDMSSDTPLTVGRSLAAVMVADPALGSSMFSEVSSHYPLGIGAAFAGDCEGFAGGIAGNHSGGLELAQNLPRPLHCVALPTPGGFGVP